MIRDVPVWPMDLMLLERKSGKIEGLSDGESVVWLAQAPRKRGRVCP